ncbi:ent-kaurenoic acid oxidase 1-like [Senna tora]|uniref:Ent-kaurenoic acid oxidase 1-like n=1 Tax=Senna tora TaxID=362788 RepID=A0A834SGB8_9FABA|nr:ent-kaurenoic acid oxidase 1-like [Senna tora]
MKPQDVTTEQVHLRAFPFSLNDSAKDWLFFPLLGVVTTERGMLDAASGSSIVDNTPAKARELISTMASTSQEFGFRQDMPRTVNETSISSI